MFRSVNFTPDYERAEITLFANQLHIGTQDETQITDDQFIPFKPFDYDPAAATSETDTSGPAPAQVTPEAAEDPTSSPCETPEPPTSTSKKQRKPRMSAQKPNQEQCNVNTPKQKPGKPTRTTSSKKRRVLDSDEE